MMNSQTFAAQRKDLASQGQKRRTKEIRDRLIKIGSEASSMTFTEVPFIMDSQAQSTF